MTYRRTLSHLTLRSRLAAKRWTRRLLFVAGGIVVGLAAIMMAKLADGAQALFGQIVTLSPFLSLLVTPLGFGLAVWLTVRVFPTAGGSGIPQVIAALQLPREQREGLVSLRSGLGKIVVMTLGLLCGASTGREGPTVQVGAAIMHAIGRVAPYRQSGFVLAGSAAGVAAAFNAPLAGIVFGIEELSRSFEARTSGLIIGAIVAAGLTSLALIGDYNYFGSTTATMPLGTAWLVVPICAALCGLLGGLFARLLVAFTRGLPGRVGQAIRRHPVLFATGCGLCVALCGLVSHGTVYGTGYEQARAIIHDGNADPLFGPWKFLATIFSAISGIPGGIFSPSLAIGAGIASDLHVLFPGTPLGALVLIGMVSYLTGVVQAPITAFVITSEMTNDHAMVIPMMASALIANAASKLVMREGVYHALAHTILVNARTPAPASRPASPVTPEPMSRPDDVT